MIQTSSLCSIHDSFCHGMWKVFFQTGSNPQSFRFRIIAKHNDFFYSWFRLCQRTGLIKYDGICLCHSLQILPTLYGNSILSGFPYCRKDRNRHSQLQCAGKIHHKNRKSFCHIACDSPDKPCPQKRIWYQTVRQMLCLAFQIGFQLF